MSAILKLVQGTAEWHAHRAQSRNASETPAVMGVSPWQTPYGLWLLRTGRKTQAVTPAMQHGTALEPSARAAYEALTGQILEPLVLTEGDYSASLDGITLGGELILEIKCPWKGRASELWKAVAASEVPGHYWWQVQHQLMVAGAALAHLYVFDGTEGILLDVKPKPETWPRIHATWDEFAHCLETDTPPPLTDRDTRERTDTQWQQAAAAYIEAKRQADEAATALDSAKTALVGLASHSSEAGGGVKVTRFSKVGAIDYKKVPELKGVDLEQYRAAARQEVRITVT
jgi:putative phage-type endonuclease